MSKRKEWKPGTPYSDKPCHYCGEALLYDPARPLVTRGEPFKPETVVHYHLDCKPKEES